MRRNQTASGVSMLGLQDFHSKGKKYQGCFWTSKPDLWSTAGLHVIASSRAITQSEVLPVIPKGTCLLCCMGPYTIYHLKDGWQYFEGCLRHLRFLLNTVLTMLAPSYSSFSINSLTATPLFQR